MNQVLQGFSFFSLDISGSFYWRHFVRQKIVARHSCWKLRKIKTRMKRGSKWGQQIPVGSMHWLVVIIYLFSEPSLSLFYFVNLTNVLDTHTFLCCFAFTRSVSDLVVLLPFCCFCLPACIFTHFCLARNVRHHICSNRFPTALHPELLLTFLRSRPNCCLILFLLNGKQSKYDSGRRCLEYAAEIDIFE